jgi:hypothetical protein
VEKAVSDELVAELLDAADDARRQIEAALEDMVLRFQLLAAADRTAAACTGPPASPNSPPPSAPTR